jgi:hypothetical protein
MRCKKQVARIARVKRCTVASTSLLELITNGGGQVTIPMSCVILNALLSFTLI